MVQISENYAKAPRPTVRAVLNARQRRDSGVVTLVLGLFVFALVFAAATFFV